MTDPVRPHPDPIAALVELLVEEIREHDPGENAEYCWWCGVDINGKHGPKQLHEQACWRVRVEAALRADADARPPSGMVAVEPGLYTSADTRPLQLPSWLTDRIKLPVRWDGVDLLDANNRVIVWGMPDGDHNEVDTALGRWVADALNAAAVPRRADLPYARILELLDQFDIRDTDELKHALEDWQRFDDANRAANGLKPRPRRAEPLKET